MDDREILAALTARDETAITALDAAYGRLCRSIACNILGSDEDAEECVNDTWIKIWASVPPDEPRSLSAYAGTITRRLAINRWHANHAACRTLDAGIPLDELDAILHGKPGLLRMGIVSIHLCISANDKISLMLLRHILKMLKILAMDPVVRINKGDIRTGCDIQTVIPGSGNTAVGLVDDADSGILYSQLLQNIQRMIGASIVDTDDLQILIGILRYGFQAPLQI